MIMDIHNWIMDIHNCIHTDLRIFNIVVNYVYPWVIYRYT